MFSDHPSPNERWLHGVLLVHMLNGGGILNTFVFICGKVSLILFVEQMLQELLAGF